MTALTEHPHMKWCHRNTAAAMGTAQRPTRIHATSMNLTHVQHKTPWGTYVFGFPVTPRANTGH